MYEAYVSLRIFLRFFLSSPPALFFAVFADLSAVVLAGALDAGALEAVEVGALPPTVDAGWNTSQTPVPSHRAAFTYLRGHYCCLNVGESGSWEANKSKS